MNATAIIPARYASTRFPGKMLVRQTGKYLIQHVYEQVCQAKTLSKILIAVDDPRIARACDEFGATWIMTRPDHPCGTDRLAEVAHALNDDLIINVQGDEPELPPRNIDILVTMMRDNPAARMGTLASIINNQADIDNPNIVKVILNINGMAIYFSRSPVPFNRDNAPLTGRYRKHIGIYAYHRETLLQFSQLPPTPLEQMEKLEQLRALENGIDIAVADVEHAAPGVDTPDQYDAFVRRYLTRQS